MGSPTVTSVIVSIMVSVSVASSFTQRRSENSGVCELEWQKFVRDRPVRLGRSVRALKKVRDVPLVLPELPPKTLGRGFWAGDVLIDVTGTVAHVWPMREIEFAPPFPTFNNAIVETIRQWEYEAPVADNKPTSVCTTVTVSVDWALR